MSHLAAHIARARDVAKQIVTAKGICNQYTCWGTPGEKEPAAGHDDAIASARAALAERYAARAAAAKPSPPAVKEPAAPAAPKFTVGGIVKHEDLPERPEHGPQGGEKAFQDRAQKVLDGMNSGEKEALRGFTNQYDYAVRELQKGEKTEAQLVEHIKAQRVAEEANTPGKQWPDRSAEEHVALAKQYLAGIESAQGRAPKEPLEVFRGIHNIAPQHVEAMLSKGEFSLNAASSSSRSPGIASAFMAGLNTAQGQGGANGYNVLLRIQQQSGLSIERASQSKHEREVLLPKGARYQITDVARVQGSDRELVIYAREIGMDNAALKNSLAEKSSGRWVRDKDGQFRGGGGKGGKGDKGGGASGATDNVPPANTPSSEDKAMKCECDTTANASPKTTVQEQLRRFAAAVQVPVAKADLSVGDLATQGGLRAPDQGDAAPTKSDVLRVVLDRYKSTGFFVMSPERAAKRASAATIAKSYDGPVQFAPQGLTHPAFTAPALTFTYDNPEDMGGWAGGIESTDQSWIAFVATNGDMLLWTSRGQDGGVQGLPWSLERLDIVPTALRKRSWTRRYINDLPDSAFLLIREGGTQDDSGKTIPRTLRRFPVRDHTGTVDRPHVANALARISQAGLDDATKERVRAEARALLDGTSKGMSLPMRYRVERVDAPATVPLVTASAPVAMAAPSTTVATQPATVEQPTTKSVETLVQYQGIPVMIDRPRGFVQQGMNEMTGQPWTRTYLCDYGYIQDTQGGDGEGLDVFIGPDPAAPYAHWVIQLRDDGSRDEFKLMLGFPSRDAAKAMYLAHVPARYYGDMVSMPVAFVRALLNLPPFEGEDAMYKALVLPSLLTELQRNGTDFKAEMGAWSAARGMGEDDAMHKALTVIAQATAETSGLPEALSRAMTTWLCQAWDGAQIATMSNVELAKAKSLVASTATALANVTLTLFPTARVNDRTHVITVAEWEQQRAETTPLPPVVAPFKVPTEVPLAAAVETPASPPVETPPVTPPSFMEAIGVEKRLACRVLSHKSDQFVRKDMQGGAQGELQYVLGIVLEPDMVDGQGETYSAEEVRKTQQLYMRSFFGNMDVQHKGPLINNVVQIVDSFIAPVDMQIEGTLVRAGSWLMGVLILDNDLWRKIKAGEITGFSISGLADKEILA